MSKPDEKNEIGYLDLLSIDANAVANDLLSGGRESLAVLHEYHDKPSAAEAILIAAHALIAQRDKINEENRAEALVILKQISEKLGDIAESLDFLAATKPDSGS
jgi:hypothetical protein